MPIQHLLLRLQVRRDCAWEQRYHRKVRGRLTQALQGSQFADLHDSNRAAFTFSDPMPYSHELNAGDELHLVVASPWAGVLRVIANDLADDPSLTAGSMLFDVRAAKPIEQDVGPPGTTGALTASSGLCIAVCDEDKVGNCETAEFWNDRHHDTDAFRRALHQAVSNVFEHETDLDSPDAPLFERYSHRKTYAVEIDVRPDQALTVVCSKWDFGYTVDDADHREHLNRLLTHGVGNYRPFGFGLLQPHGEATDRAGAAGVAHA